MVWFCLFGDRERVSVDDFMEAVRQRRERKIELVVLLLYWEKMRVLAGDVREKRRGLMVNWRLISGLKS